MSFFMLNIVLTFAWAAVSSSFTALNLAVGFVVGLLVIWLLSAALGAEAYLKVFRKRLAYIIFFLRELLKSSFRVAREVLSPNYNIHPGVIGVVLDEDTDDLQATLLANTITLTPGTLSLDIIEDEESKRRTLYIHAISIDDVEALRREIKEEFEKRAKEVMGDE
ncbi:MAG: Na+/H+ antiporter subunit E [Deinococcales bacterium]